MRARRQNSLCIAFAAIWAIRPIPAISDAPADFIVETIERSFTVQGRPALRVKNAEGRIRIVAGKQPQVQIRAIKEVRGASSIEDARQYADRIHVRIEQNGSRIQAEATYPSMNRFPFGREPEALVHLEIIAPMSSDLEASNADGEIQLEGIEGKIKAQTADGKLSIVNCSGQIESRTADGDLRVQGAAGDVSAKTSDGSVSIDGVFQALNAVSGDGRMIIKVIPGSKMMNDWSIRSGGGNIRVSLPEDFAADLDASTGDGRIRVDYPVSSERARSENKLTGKLNAGGRLLRIRTGDGDITIEKQ